jgi:hypothetical protein
MPDRRQFHKRVHSGARGHVSGQARHPGRGQCHRDAFGYRSPGQILTSFHRVCRRSESAAQKVTLPIAARAAVSLKRGRDGICDLVGYVSIACRHQSRGRVSWRCIYNRVKEIGELLLRIVQNCGPAAPHEAGWT